jgi:hypothetical protein
MPYRRAQDEGETPAPENDDPKVREGDAEDEAPEGEGHRKHFFR